MSFPRETGVPRASLSFPPFLPPSHLFRKRAPEKESGAHQAGATADDADFILHSSGPPTAREWRAVYPLVPCPREDPRAERFDFFYRYSSPHRGIRRGNHKKGSRAEKTARCQFELKVSRVRVSRFNEVSVSQVRKRNVPYRCFSKNNPTHLLRAHH